MKSIPSGFRHTALAAIPATALALLAGCNTPSTAPQSPEDSYCNGQVVRSATDAAQLRAIASRCEHDVHAASLARSRLNALTPTGLRQISLQAAPDPKDSQPAELRADVFFNFLEAYPPDIAFEKLDDLIRRVNEGYAIRSIHVIGSEDPNEVGPGSTKLSTLRVEFIRRFFSASGLKSDVLIVSERGPIQPNTLMGRARDRVAEITVEFDRKAPNGW